MQHKNADFHIILKIFKELFNDILKLDYNFIIIVKVLQCFNFLLKKI